MYTYYYTQDDFPKASYINYTALQNIILIEISSFSYMNLINSSDGISFDLEIIFNDELNASDKAILDNIIANYIYVPFYDTMCVVKDIKPTGVNGGAFTQNIWQTRELNIIEGVADFIGLKNNQITLVANVYRFNIKAPACDVKNHQIKLKNVDTNVEYFGTCEYATGGNCTSSELVVRIDIPVISTFELYHMCSKTTSDYGLGLSTGFSPDEIYTTVTVTII